MSRELRMIITQNCNYECYFCHREGIEETVIANLIVLIMNICFLCVMKNMDGTKLV